MKIRITIFAAMMAAVTMCWVYVSEAGEIKTINVSYVTDPFNLPTIVTKELGLLEKEFEPSGIEVKYHEITSGAKQAQAMAGGFLDFASVINSTSVILFRAAGSPITIISGYSKPTGAFAIVARDPAIKSVADLRGRKVAGPKGTVLHQLLSAALAEHDMTTRDLDFISMQLPQARAALLAGHLDAALLAASHIIKAEEAGCRVIATAEGLIVPKLVIGAREALAREHPEIIDRYLKVHRQAMDFIEQNTDEAVAIGARDQGISIEDARRLYQWTTFITKMSREDVESMNDDQIFMHENDMLKNVIDLSQLLHGTAVE